MEDQILYCRHCGREFAFTVGEQEFYARKQLIGPPGRCPDCRIGRRQGGRAQNNSGNRAGNFQHGYNTYSAPHRQRQF